MLFLKEEFEIENLKEALSALVNMGYSQSDALTEIDRLSKMMPANYVLSAIDTMEDNYYIGEYKKSIFLGKDNRYHIFINSPDGKRLHFANKDKKNLENKIKNYKKKNIKILPTLTCCFKDIYCDYISFKEKDASIATANKLKWAYNRYILGSYIETEDISSMTVMDLKEFCLEQIDKFKLTDKGYKELKGLLNSLFDYAVDSGITQCNTAKQMSKINSKKFRKVSHNPETQVFSFQEEVRLYNEAYNMFIKTKNTAYLAVILSGCLGLRVGELVALKYEDFDFKDMTVHIRRQEIRNYQKDNHDNYIRNGYSVVDYLKTDESVRSLPMSEPVINIYNLLVEYNKENEIQSDYLLISKSTKERMTQNHYANALKRVNQNAGLIQRSNHKLRKTLLSELEYNIGRTYTRAYAGHSHNSVTLERNYLYPTSPLSSQTNTVNDLVSKRVPSALKV